MALSDEDKQRVAEELRQMIAEYRFKPTQELEDGLGLRVAVMPADERDYVPELLLEIVAAEAAERRW
jgi:hypothetical protein